LGSSHFAPILLSYRTYELTMNAYNGELDPDLNVERRKDHPSRRAPTGAGMIIAAVLGAVIWTLIEGLVVALWHWLR
jgi:hypothetical protein